MNYAQTEGQASLEDMTTAAIKIRLLDVMFEKESKDYVIGWLKSAYIYPNDQATERQIAISQLKKYGF
jgi:hypothetical protein